MNSNAFDTLSGPWSKRPNPGNAVWKKKGFTG